MYEIKPLEEEWAKYNKKKRRPLYITIIVLSLIIAAVSLLDYKNISLFTLDTNKSVDSSKIKPSDVLVDTSITKLEVNQESSDATKVGTDKIRPVKITTSDNNPMEPGDVFIDEDESLNKGLKTATGLAVVEKVKPSKKIHFEIIDADSSVACQEVESRFSVAPDTDDALFLARVYYEKGNYKKSAHWALETNKLNGDIEESWLIFARSKAKTGQKNEAIRVLSQYAKKSNSVEANKLLHELKR